MHSSRSMVQQEAN